MATPDNRACYRYRPRTCTAGNPIQPASGEKLLTETDYRSGGAFPLEFTRHYNSTGFYTPRATEPDPGILGPVWRHTWQRRILIEPAQSPGQITLAYVLRANDHEYFRLIDGLWTPRSDVAGGLTGQTNAAGQHTGWQYRSADDELEHYDADGRLLSVTNRDGRTVTLHYSDAHTPADIAPETGLLIEVRADDGRRLQFSYTPRPYQGSPMLTALTDPAGNRYEYQYGPGQSLAAVLYPGDGAGGTPSARRQYLYNEPAHTPPASISRTLLTGILDENGQRYATYTYDGLRATASWHGEDAGKVTVSYYSRPVVTTALGNPVTRRITTIHGEKKDTGTDQPCTATGCTGVVSSTLAYDAAGYPAKQTGIDGVTTRYTHDERGLETRRIEASGTPAQRTIDTAWHASFRLPVERRVTDAQGVPVALSRQSYNVRGQPEAHCDIDPAVADATAYACGSTPHAPAGVRQTRYRYCEAAQTAAGICPREGLLLEADGPRTDSADLTTWRYYSADDPAGAYRKGELAAVTDALGQRTAYLGYDAHGRLLRSRDPNGVLTDYAWHPRGWLRSRTVRTRADGAPSGTDLVTTFIHDPAGNLTRMLMPGGAVLTYTYDAAHRLTGIEDDAGNRIAYELDAVGNRLRETVTDSSGAPVQARRRIYDRFSRLQQDLAAADPASATVFAYDTAGNPVRQTSPLGSITLNAYDAFGRLTRTTDPANAATTTTYDAADRIKTVTDPKGLVTTYTHDGLGNLTRLQSPDSGTSTYTYDSAGNLTGTTDARNQSLTLTRDALGRLTRTQTSDDIHLYTYDTCPNGKGRLCAMQNGAGQIGWDYDAHGRITQRSTTVGAHTLTTGTSFDAAGRLSTLTTPSGHTLAYTWDKDRLTAVSLDGTPLITDITRAPFGALDAWRWADGADTVRLFNRNGEPIAQAVQLPNATTHSTVLTRDAAGRITHIEETDATAQTYTYDLADRLKQAEGPWGTLTWNYDATGNRQSQIQTGVPLNTGYNYPTTSHRLQNKGGPNPKTYTYDPSGRLTSDGSLTYVHDGAGRLKEIRQGANVMRYGYSPDGRRLYKDNGTEQRLFVHDEQGHLLGEYRATDTSWTLVAEYVWLGELPVATIKPDPNNPNATQVYRIEPDHLGTPRRVADSQNNTVWRWSSAPFGDTVPNEDPSGSGQAFTLNLRFAGQYFDRESGMHYNYNRYYDAQTGRYVSSDPIGLEGGINTYVYVENDPANWTDPEGLKTPRPAQPGGNARNRRQWDRHNPTTIRFPRGENNIFESAGYFDDNGDFICLRWNCPKDTQSCSIYDWKRANDFLPAATDPNAPPKGCYCDTYNYRPQIGPQIPGIEDLLGTGEDVYEFIRNGHIRRIR